MGRLVFSERDLDTASGDVLKGINKAVLAAAYKIRDNMREEFIKGGSLYKHRTSAYDELAKGIVVGKMTNGFVKVHALGNTTQYNSFKTRFFVGGTVVRKIKTGKGKGMTKGYIKKNDAVEKGLIGGQETLNKFINNVLK